MSRPRIQFGTKAFLGVTSMIAISLGAMRQIYDVCAFDPPNAAARFIASLCILTGCCFGISGFIVGWPIRGFLFGLAFGGIAILAVLYLTAQI